MTLQDTDWHRLQKEISGELFLPGSAGYEKAFQPAVARFHDIHPRALVMCAGPVDVAEAISLAQRSGIETAIRSGGHSFAGYSTTTGLVIDVSPMNSVNVSDGIATVGAGAQLAHVYDKLDRIGLSIPAGCGPSVGIAGLTLGGGLGILGRKHGLTSDHLIGADVVLADGRIVSCDDTNDSDLFWALRGAGGGNFGVVTSMRFTTIPVPDLTVFHLVWPYSEVSRVIDSWQNWAPASPDGLAASLLVSVPGHIGKDPVVNVFGTMLGSESQTVRMLDEMVGMVASDPTTTTHEQITFRDAKRYLNDLGDGPLHGETPQPDGLGADGHSYSKSEFFRQTLPGDAIAELTENLVRERVSGQSRELDFSPWGGAYNRVDADATAFPHRSELFLLKQAVAVPSDASPRQREEATTWLDRSWTTTHPWGTGGVYPNFPDPELEDWGPAYYGENYSRLTEIKRRYDPDGFFRFDQSIPVAHA